MTENNDHFIISYRLHQELLGITLFRYAGDSKDGPGYTLVPVAGIPDVKQQEYIKSITDSKIPIECRVFFIPGNPSGIKVIYDTTYRQ